MIHIRHHYWHFNSVYVLYKKKGKNIYMLSTFEWCIHQTEKNTIPKNHVWSLKCYNKYTWSFANHNVNVGVNVWFVVMHRIFACIYQYIIWLGGMSLYSCTESTDQSARLNYIIIERLIVKSKLNRSGIVFRFSFEIVWLQ